MNVDQLTAKKIRKMLPYKGLSEVHRRLTSKGINFSYVTVQTFTNQQVIQEAIAYLNELAEKEKQDQKASKTLLKNLRLGIY